MFPRLEVFSEVDGARVRSSGPRRALIFFLVFLGCMLLGQGLNYWRDPLYRSTATVLTVAPQAVDEHQRSDETDLQHVAVQRQLLLGGPMLDDTLETLRQTEVPLPESVNAAQDLRNRLSVTPLPATHLVELAAIGEDPAFLTRLVNTWIEVYVARRAQAVADDVGDTLEQLQAREAELQTKLAAKRKSVDAFAAEHDILSEGRENNRAEAQLAGLNKSLNQAREDQVQARADYDALRQAISAGEPLVPESEKRALVQLRSELAAMREKLKELEGRYTSEYRWVDPDFADLPQQIREKEKALAVTLEQGQKILLAEAEKLLHSRMVTTLEFEQQLAEHRREAMLFNSRFSQYQTMLEDLQALEQQSRDLKGRMADIESRSLQRFPQVKVVDWAYQPITPYHPDYTRDAVLIGIGSLALALLSVWLVDYLRRDPAAQPQAGPTLSGIRVYADAPPAVPHQPQAPVAPMTLPHTQMPGLAAPSSDELLPAEIQALWRMADNRLRWLLGLLLSGLNEQELLAFSVADLDAEHRLLRVAGESGRQLPVADYLLALADLGDPGFADLSELNAELSLLACDAGLSRPERVGVAAIRHSYILYLVRQGARLRELPQVLGPMSSRILNEYAAHSPNAQGKTLRELELVYPLNTH